jgi:hypothetical protein
VTTLQWTLIGIGTAVAVYALFVAALLLFGQRSRARAVGLIA